MLKRKPVNIVCVGTGVEGPDMAPGSEPAYYVLHRIATAVGAFAYKNKNAASSLARASIILEALQYPFHRLTSLADEHLHFARQYGVLTDLATFQPCSNKKFKPVRFTVDGAVKYLSKQEGKRGRPSKKTEYVDDPTGMVLSIPAKARSRYEMSAAQLALCRIGYGVSPRAPTCDGFEGTVVDFVLFALLAGPPPPQSRLLYDDLSDRHPAFVLLDQLYEGETVRPAHVTVYQLHVTLDKHADCPLGDVLGVVKQDLCNNHAVILLNAPKASYADVMVLLPRGRLLLLQCKYYTATRLSDTNAKVEYDEMGLEDPTTQLLQSLFPEKSPCLRDNVFRMIVVCGPQDDSPVVDRNGKDSAGCYVLHLRPDVISKAASDVSEGEERVEEDAMARAFKSSTARLLYPLQISVNVNAVKKFDRDSFETPMTKKHNRQ